jgi:small subunit ribosomal protein S6
MAATKPLYDLVLMLDTAAEESRRAEILASTEEAVGKDGEIVNKQDWGARALAFEIRHKKDADYHLLQFHGTPELLRQLDRTLRITDEVVRFRIIKLAPGTPAPPEQRVEARAGSAPTEGESPVDASGYEADAAPAAAVEDVPAEAPVADAAPADAEAAPAAADAEPAETPA